MPVQIKQCNQCGETLPLDEYYVVGHKKDGSPRRAAICRSCKKTNVIRQAAERRARDEVLYKAKRASYMRRRRAELKAAAANK